MKIVNAELITIGDEILYGQTLDTNAHWMSSALGEIGIKVIRRTTVGDLENEILKALTEAECRADIILITGGLGPTNDDLTKPCLAIYFDCDVVVNEQALKELRKYMTGRGRKLNKLTRLQASLPEKCELVNNERGTAGGMWFNNSGIVFVAMPGVPHEMKHMMKHKVIPRLKDEFELPVIYHKIVRLAGIGESWLAEQIETWENALPGNIRLAYLPTYGDIKMRLTATGKELEVLKTQTNELVDQLLPLINDYVYGFDDETLESVIGRLLKEKNDTLAVAESCTGGYISHKITSIAGSSEYFNGSIVPYQNEMKIRELGIRETTLIDHGAVSEVTVIEMAQNVREKLSANIGLASSGIAGPGGGTEEKPVGTIWIACADEHGFITKKLQLTKDRSVNIRLATVAALNMLHKRLVKND